MKLKHGTIKHLQSFVAFKNELRGLNDETLCQRLVLLSEEVGELMRACYDAVRGGRTRKKQANIEEELADVINVALSIGNRLNIDIERGFVKKMKIIDKRFGCNRENKNNKDV